MRHQVAAQHLQLLADLETGDVVGLDRGADRDRRHQLFLDDRLAPETRQRGVDIIAQNGEIGNGDAVVAAMRRDNVGGTRKDRKSVASGTRVSESVELGGRRILKQTKTKLRTQS